MRATVPSRELFNVTKTVYDPTLGYDRNIMPSPPYVLLIFVFIIIIIIMKEEGKRCLHRSRMLFYYYENCHWKKGNVACIAQECYFIIMKTVIGRRETLLALLKNVILLL